MATAPMAAKRFVFPTVSPLPGTLGVSRLHLGKYCSQRAATPDFAQLIKEQVIARTAVAVQLLNVPTLQPYIASLTAESRSTWTNLHRSCEVEELNARELPDVKADGSNLQHFLDVLQGLSTRRDILAMLLTMTSEDVYGDSSKGSSSIVSPQQSSSTDNACAFGDAWQSTFLATRMKWHMLQEDFLHVCSGATPVVNAEGDVITLVEEAALSIHEMCVGEFGVSPNVEIETNCNQLLFCGIPDQIRYIVAELLKNASVASVQSGNLDNPIKVRVMMHSDATGSTADMFSVTIVDAAGGVPPLALQNMWRLGWSGQSTQRRIAGFGVGLPLAGIYASLFGGCVTAAPTVGTASAGTMFTLMHPVVGIESSLTTLNAPA